MRRIAYTDGKTGALCLVTPVINSIGEAVGFTEDHALERAMTALPQDALNVQVVEESQVPTDRTFRNAWTQDTKGAPVVDMDKARDIHRDRMREARKPKLGALDVEFMRAVESGKSTSEVMVAKQGLRDVTKDPAIDAAKTPDDLKKVWPEILS